MLCKICKNKLTIHIHDIFDDRYGYPKLFDIYQCLSCKSFQTDPPFDPKEVGDLYSSYYPRQNIDPNIVKKRADSWKPKSKFRNWLSGEHRIHHTLEKAPRPGMKVLDIGCGDGSSLLELEKIGYKASGIETDNNVSKVKGILNLDIHIGTIENSSFPLNYFDTVIANQVIEHVTNLDSFIENIKKISVIGGKIILSTPNAKSIFRMIYGRKWIHWHIPYHQQIFSRYALSNILEKYGLRVTKILTVSPSSWTMHEINRLRFKAELGVKNPFWTALGKSEKIRSSILGKVARKILFYLMSLLGKIANLLKYGNCLIIYAENIKK